MNLKEQGVQIEVYNRPKELKSETIRELMKIASKAFSGNSFPPRRDTLDHISSASSLAVAFKEKPVGFCSIKKLNRKFILHHAIAVEPEHQGERLGTQLLDLAALKADTESEFLLGGRTQNPFYINYIRERGGYPRVYQNSPREIQNGVEKLAKFYPGSLKRGEHLLRRSYIRSPYSKSEALKSERELEPLFNSQISFLKGDAILPVTKTSKASIERKLKSRNN